MIGKELSKKSEAVGLRYFKFPFISQTANICYILNLQAYKTIAKHIFLAYKATYIF